jgi:hypothetical protein
MTMTVNNAAGRASMYTIDASETHRIFVVNQSYPTEEIISYLLNVEVLLAKDISIGQVCK